MLLQFMLKNTLIGNLKYIHETLQLVILDPIQF